MVSDERIVADDGLGMVHDSALTADMEPCWFDHAYWQGRNGLQAMAGGRGGVFVVDTPLGAAVLRHYRRGGSVARVLGDRYLWTGISSVRSVAEYRLLRRLYEAGLPVPLALGGAWRRDGLYYSADLLTRQIPSAGPLSDDLARILRDPSMPGRIGKCVGRFHAAGVFHADLNAHNILVDGEQNIWLIDFDRGRILQPQAAWQQANLRRLHRSLAKLAGGAGLAADWQGDWWDALLAAHAREVSPA